MLDLIIKNGKCFINGELKDIDVSVKDGKIQSIGQITEEANETLDAKDLIDLEKLLNFDDNSLYNYYNGLKTEVEFEKNNINSLFKKFKYQEL